MKVKAVDIAERLGISKATVSLALNGKPGVGEETRARVLRCKEEMEAQLDQMIQLSVDAAPTENPVVVPEKVRNLNTGNIIKVIMFDRRLGVLCDPALNVWSEMLRVFDSEMKEYGYEIGITYVGAQEDEIDRLVEECNQDSVAGVLLYATEMQEGDFDLGFRQIRKPMVVYDFDAGSRYHSVVIDNENAVENAVKFFQSRGCESIYYLSQKISIYNFEERRSGFLAGCYKAKLDSRMTPMIRVGNSVDEAYTYMKSWLVDHELPDALILENYQVTIGVVKALLEEGVSIPEDVSLIGVDEVPSYMTGGVEVACVQVPHVERGRVAIHMLLDEIETSAELKLKVATRSQLMLKHSVK